MRVKRIARRTHRGTEYRFHKSVRDNWQRNPAQWIRCESQGAGKAAIAPGWNCRCQSAHARRPWAACLATSSRPSNAPALMRARRGDILHFPNMRAFRRMRQQHHQPIGRIRRAANIHLPPHQIGRHGFRIRITARNNACMGGVTGPS